MIFVIVIVAVVVGVIVAAVVGVVVISAVLVVVEELCQMGSFTFARLTNLGLVMI